MPEQSIWKTLVKCWGTSVFVLFNNYHLPCHILPQGSTELTRAEEVGLVVAVAAAADAVGATGRFYSPAVLAAGRIPLVRPPKKHSMGCSHRERPQLPRLPQPLRQLRIWASGEEAVVLTYSWPLPQWERSGRNAPEQGSCWKWWSRRWGQQQRVGLAAAGWQLLPPSCRQPPPLPGG